MFSAGTQYWICVFVLLFGAKRLPEAARSLGRSMRVFKAEITTMRQDDEQAHARHHTASDTD